jgi:hypothetical protein
MSDTPDNRFSAADRKDCLEVTLRPAASSIQGIGGQAISFSRAVLQFHNICDAALASITPRATLGQEGGTVQDVSGVLSLAAALPAGETVAWDVYDLLIPAHPGAASKVHMFGYRAVLNWRFELTVWAEYTSADTPQTVAVPARSWAFRWHAAEPSGGEIVLDIEEVKI